MKSILRALRFFFTTIIVFVTLTFAFVYLLSDHFKNILVQELRNQVNDNVTVELEKIDLTWVTHFPDISLELRGLEVHQTINDKVDTLVSINELGLGLDISQLLQNDFTIEKIFLKNGMCSMKVLDKGVNNYNIFKPRTKTDTSNILVNFELEQIFLTNFYYEFKHLPNEGVYSFHFEKTTSNLLFENKVWDISLNGPLSVEHIMVSGNDIAAKRNLDTDLHLLFDPELQSFSLKKSNLKINGGRFDISGIYINNDTQHLDLHLKARESQISNVTSFLPPEYAKTFAPYKTEGKVYFSADILGNLANERPKITVDFGFKDASFFDPNTKQNITDASLKGQFTNGSSRSNKTSSINLEDFSFKVQEGHAQGKFSYSNFEAPLIDMKLNFSLPFSDIIELSGLERIVSPAGNIKGNVLLKSSLDHLINDPQNPNLVSRGDVTLEDVAFGIVNADLPCRAINGKFLINKTDLGVINFIGKAGKSDFKINGVAKNFIPFIFAENEDLNIQGDFAANKLDFDQLLSQNNEEVSSQEDQGTYNFKISDWLSFDLACKINEIKFRRLNGKDALNDISGELKLKDQIFSYDNINFNLAGGRFSNHGTINGQKYNQITVKNKSTLEKLDVKSFFYVFENFNQEFVTEKNLKGKMSGNYEFELLFDQKLRLDYDAIIVNTDLKITYGELSNFGPLMDMNSYLTKKKYKKYVQNADLSKVVFSTLESKIWVEDGSIHIPNTTIKNSLAQITISGIHSFDNKIDYSIDFPLVNYDKHKGGHINERKHLNVLMEITGTVDDYEIKFKEKEIIEDLGTVIKNSVQQDNGPDDHDYIGIDTTEEEEDFIDF